MPSPEVRLLRMSRPSGARLAAVVLLAACASGASVALLGVSAWLIVRASFHPPVLWLMVAVVGVRFFGISRGAFRYAERLLSHDVAFDALRSLRLGVYRRLERIAPIGPVWRRGDLLDRLIADVDALADLITRVVLPLASIALVTGGAVLTAFLILPAAGALLLAAALLAMVVGPALVWRGEVRDASAVREVRARRSALVAESVLAASDPGLRALRGSWVARLAELDDREQRLASRGSSRRCGCPSAP
ncbi:ABC transporter domain-containing protein [Cumulibacter manganitolerans]|uniref:hypothetical protein n=1 Tax=Cumulibacter manganitolerans TaxID=1884992 RepID=UPI001295AD65|nr:hypothetical protein [Cumulibacter manganitolerans]